MSVYEAVYAAIRHLPLAKYLVRASRQQLVAHSDGICQAPQNTIWDGKVSAAPTFLAVTATEGLILFTFAALLYHT